MKFPTSKMTKTQTGTIWLSGYWRRGGGGGSVQEENWANAPSCPRSAAAGGHASVTYTSNTSLVNEP